MALSHSFSKHEYDIDFIDLYYGLENLTKKAAKVLKPKLNKKQYLQQISSLINIYCKDKGVDADFVFRHRHLMILPSDSVYPIGLALEIITRDFHKLNEFLEVQQNKFPNSPDFIDLLRFQVYALIDKFSPLADNGQRKAWLMSWVKEQRSYPPLDSNTESEAQRQAQSMIGLRSQKSEKSPGKKGKGSQKSIPLVTIEDIFYSKDKFKYILNLLEREKLISPEGMWIGQTSKKTEILVLLNILKEKEYIKKGSQTTIARCFCEYFGVKLKDRTFRYVNKSMSEQSEYYDRIIPEVSKSKKY